MKLDVYVEKRWLTYRQTEKLRLVLRGVRKIHLICHISNYGATTGEL